jgi:hypothetical protein
VPIQVAVNWPEPFITAPSQSRSCAKEP